jgi:prepilin-type N-terminal cleavage/methylation domain-containing protein/prepilin-type processing-associated H-X9-DG protein
MAYVTIASELRKCTRRGFSLVELLVTIGIASLLLSLTLPAVMRARAGAQDVLCRQRLHAIGVALANHEAEKGYFPAAILSNPGSIAPESQLKVVVPHVVLLPYLEENSLYDAFNLVLYHDYANRTLAQVRLASFLCPSEPQEQARVNYRANAGSHPYFPIGNGTLGAFPPHYTRNYARDFRDGLAATVTFSERVAGDFTDDRYSINDRYSPFQDIFITELQISWTLETLRQHCATNAATRTDHISSAGGSGMHQVHWFYFGAYSFKDAFYMHGASPNSPIPDCGDLPFITSYMFVNARSWHDGKVNVLFGDGSVKSFADSTDEGVWRALGERDDGGPPAP